MGPQKVDDDPNQIVTKSREADAPSSAVRKSGRPRGTTSRPHHLRTATLASSALGDRWTGTASSSRAVSSVSGARTPLALNRCQHSSVPNPRQVVDKSVW